MLWFSVCVIGGVGVAAAMEERDEIERIQSGVAVRNEGASYWDGATAYTASAPGDVPLDTRGFEGVATEGAGDLVTPEPVLDEPPPESTPSVDATTPTPPIEEPLGGTLTVALTFYVCQNAPPGQSYCGTMSSGLLVYEGAAACGYGMALGTRFSIVGEGRVYVCEDRGAGPYWWIDIFWYDYYAGRAWSDQWPQSVEIAVLP